MAFPSRQGHYPSTMPRGLPAYVAVDETQQSYRETQVFRTIPAESPSGGPAHARQTLMSACQSDNRILYPHPNTATNPAVHGTYQHYEVEMQDAAMSLEEALDEIHDLREQLKLLKAERNHLVKEKKYQQNRIGELNTQVATLNFEAQNRGFLTRLWSRGATGRSPHQHIDLEQKLRRDRQELERLRSANHELVQQLQKCTEEKEKSDRRSSRLESRTYSLSERIQDLLQSRARLDDKYIHMREQVAKLNNDMKTQRATFSKELKALREKASLSIPKVSDAMIRSEWDALAFAIRQFVAQRLPGSLSATAVEHLSPVLALSTVPHAKEVLQNPFLCPLMLQSWVWRILWDNVFETFSPFWGGIYGRHLNKGLEMLRNFIEQDAPENFPRSTAWESLHDIRVRSVDFIKNLRLHDRGSPSSDLRKQMAGVFRPLVSHQFPHLSQDEVDRILSTSLKNVIHQAAKIDMTLRTSRAFFKVYISPEHPTPPVNSASGFPFNDQTMDFVQNLPCPKFDEPPTVDLVVSPGILKMGNADGKGYTEQLILVKLKALCGSHIILDAMQGGGDVKAEPSHSSSDESASDADSEEEGPEKGPEIRQEVEDKTLVKEGQEVNRQAAKTEAVVKDEPDDNIIFGWAANKTRNRKKYSAKQRVEEISDDELA